MSVRLSKQVMAAHGAALTPSGRALLRHLAVLAGPDGAVRWALSDAQLQRELGLSRSSVKAARKLLADEGLVDVVETGSGRHATVYRLVAGVAQGQLAAAVGEHASDPQRVEIRPPEGRDSTPSSPGAPPIRAGKVSTTYGSDGVPPATSPPYPAGPPPASGRVEDRLIDELVMALPDELIPRTGFDRVRLCRAAAPMLAAGWPPDELADAVVQIAPLPHAVISGVGLLEARLRTVNRERPRAAPPPPSPWCGSCDEHNRWRETAAGWVKCPDCHPGAGAPAF